MKNYLDLKDKNIDEEKILDKNVDKKLKDISLLIKKGGIVVFPTETVYAIGTNGLDKDAIEKLYKVKKRPKNKPISLLVCDIKMIKNLVEDINEIEYKLIKNFFPGPLTLILKKKKIVPDILTSNGDYVGIRMPENKIALKLIKYSRLPIAAPSANISGNRSGIDINNIMNEFGNDVDYYIDGGISKLGIGSTIVKVVDGKVEILRQGSITKEDINKVLNM